MMMTTMTMIFTEEMHGKFTNKAKTKTQERTSLVRVLSPHSFSFLHLESFLSLSIYLLFFSYTLNCCRAFCDPSKSETMLRIQTVTARFAKLKALCSYTDDHLPVSNPSLCLFSHACLFIRFTIPIPSPLSTFFSFCCFERFVSTSVFFALYLRHRWPLQHREHPSVQILVRSRLSIH